MIIVYVSKMHEFTLRGPLDKLRILNYLDTILNLLGREKLDEKTRRETVERLRRTIKTLS